MTDGLKVVDNAFDLAKIGVAMGSPALFFDVFKENPDSVLVLLTTQVILLGLTYYGVIKSAFIAGKKGELII